MDKDDLARLQSAVRLWRKDLNAYGSKCVKIIDKTGRECPFALNTAQQYMEERIEEQKNRKGYVRVIILKGRQQGASKYNDLRQLRNTTLFTNVNAFVMAHDANTTSSLFDDYKALYESLPDIEYIKPSKKRSNAKELVFDEVGSKIRIGTAGSSEVGRGTTINRFHGCLSEDSLIVRDDGSTVSMGDVSVGDMVITSSGAIAPVSAKFYTGEKQTYTLSVWCSGEDIHLTEDHKVLTDDGYKTLGELTTDSFVAMPKINSGSLGVYNHEYKNGFRPQGGGSKSIESADIELDNGFGYTLGYYLAEGHVKSDLGCVQFACHRDEDYIEHVLKRCDGLYSSYSVKTFTDSKRKVISVYGKFFTTLINDICGRVDGKHAPSWFFSASDEFLSGVLNGYLDGDGSKTQNDKVTAPSVHEKIARQMQRICWRLYGAASVSKHERDRYGKKTKDIYLLRMSGNPYKMYSGKPLGKRIEKSFVRDGQVFCRVKSISPRNVERVWDIEVGHKDHNYQTTACVVSNSECAFWQDGDKILAGVLQAVPLLEDTEVVLESTANGVGNKFYKLCMQAMRKEGEFELIFIPWWWTDEYQLNDDEFEATDAEWEYYDTYISKDVSCETIGMKKLAWRRAKIYELGEKKFKQEYPANPTEAFQMSGSSLFKPEWVKCAQDTKIIEDKSVPLVIGVDAAEAGGDRTAICFRRGNKVLSFNTHAEMDEMRLAGIMHKIILDMKPAKVFFDKAYANGCVQRLHELGHAGIAKAIPFGSGAIEADRFINKRAEMHWVAKEWLEQGYVDYDPETGQGGVDIPVNDAFAADLACIPEPPPTSNGKIKMVDKLKIKQEYGMSPDLLDAFILTFAEPVSINHTDSVRVKTKSASDIIYGR